MKTRLEIIRDGIESLKPESKRGIVNRRIALELFRTDMQFIGSISHLRTPSERAHPDDIADCHGENAARIFSDWRSMMRRENRMDDARTFANAVMKSATTEGE